MCLDASTSSCGAPTSPALELFDPPTGDLFGFSGGPAVNVSNQQSINVTGLAYNSGTVTLSVDSVGGPVVATATASGNNGAATFSVGIDTGAFTSAGSHSLVGWQTSGSTTLQASVSLNVTILH